MFTERVYNLQSDSWITAALPEHSESTHLGTRVSLQASLNEVKALVATSFHKIAIYVLV